MVTSTEDTPRDYELGEQNNLDVKGGAVIFKGSAVGSILGLVRPLVKADLFVGFASRKADNSGGVDGQIKADILTRGRIPLLVGSAGIANLGADVYASDDMTFTLTATGNTKIGKIIRIVSSGEAIVSFNAGT